MSIGTSGRIVIEVDPALKRALYAVLAREGSTLKEWFVARASSFVEGGGQMSLDFEGHRKGKIDAAG